MNYDITLQPVLSFLAVVLLTIGIIGNGFEMRKIRLSTHEADSKSVFLDKRNFKWYVIIGIALVLWAINQTYT